MHRSRSPTTASLTHVIIAAVAITVTVCVSSRYMYIATGVSVQSGTNTQDSEFSLSYWSHWSWKQLDCTPGTGGGLSHRIERVLEVGGRCDGDVCVRWRRVRWLGGREVIDVDTSDRCARNSFIEVELFYCN